MSIFLLLLIILSICVYYFFFLKNSIKKQIIKFCNEYDCEIEDLKIPNGASFFLDFYELVIKRISIHDIFVKRVKEYGPVSYFWIGFRKFLLVSDPEALKYILSNDKSFSSSTSPLSANSTSSFNSNGSSPFSPFIPSSPSTSTVFSSLNTPSSQVVWRKIDDHLMKCIMSDSILTTEGDIWKEKRKRLSKAFRYDYLFKMLPVFVSKSQIMLNEIEKKSVNNQPVEMHSLFSKITLDIIGRVGFKHEFNSLIDSKSPYFEMTKKMLQGFETRLPIPKPLVTLESRLRLSTFFKTIDQFWYLVGKTLYSRKDEKIAQLDQENDILSLILSQNKKKKENEEINNKKNDGDNNNNKDDEINNNKKEKNDETNKEEEKSILADLVTFIAAGFETSSLNLTWTLYLLSKNRECLIKCQEEIDKVLGYNTDLMEGITSDGNSTTIIDNSKLEQLEYLTYCINESLRLIPPVTNLMPRVSAESDAICGKWFVPKGTLVLCTFYPLHRSEIYWEEPEKFIPERWNKQNSKKCIPINFYPSVVDNMLVLEDS